MSAKGAGAGSQNNNTNSMTSAERRAISQAKAYAKGQKQEYNKAKKIVNKFFFTNIPYDEDWKKTFTSFIENEPNMNDALQMLRTFNNYLSDITNINDLKKKHIQIENRLHNLKKKAYLQELQKQIDKTTDSTKKEFLKQKKVQIDAIEKIGCVVVRKDNQALLVHTQKDGKKQYGFPKGKYEYKLLNSNDIFSSIPEGFAKGALRELKEETGFQYTGKINIAKNKYTGTLKRTIDNTTDTLSITGGSYFISGENFYLILYVDSDKELKKEAVPANNENIDGVGWTEQYIESNGYFYNGFSKHKFLYKEDTSNNNSENNSNYKVFEEQYEQQLKQKYGLQTRKRQTKKPKTSTRKRSYS